MSTEISPIALKNYVCEVCSISCAKKSEWTKHINTKKHKNNTIGEIINQSHACPCGKIYKERSGLWRHTQTCKFEKKETIIPIEKEYSIIKNENMVELLMKENIEFKNIVLEVVKNNVDLQKQTHEMQKQIMEMCKQGNGLIKKYK